MLCLAWTSDGQFLALGMFNGAITLRDRQGVEKSCIQRNSPVWTISFNPSREEGGARDVLAVGCWDGTLSFYQLNGGQQGRDIQLGYDPCCVSYFAQACPLLPPPQFGLQRLARCPLPQLSFYPLARPPAPSLDAPLPRRSPLGWAGPRRARR